MPTIEKLTGSEILDSRGRPTVRAVCELAGGIRAAASVPSGASTGLHEAVELRDGDPSRYRGLGCRSAAANITGELNDTLAGSTIDSQAELDALLIGLDGTPNKSRLGANAILAVSIAFARARAAANGQPLFRHFAEIAGTEPAAFPRRDSFQLPQANQPMRRIVELLPAQSSVEAGERGVRTGHSPQPAA